MIAVHKAAMSVEGAMEFLMMEREVGILSDLQLRHLLARGRNAKEKPVERLFKDISEKMSEFKGRQVEVRYSDEDYGRVWVVLPGGEVCEAGLITPTPLLNPDRKTLKTVAEARAREKRIIRDYQLIQQSAVRGEDTEARVGQSLNPAAGFPVPEDTPARVHLLHRLDRPLTVVAQPRVITAADVAAAQADFSILETSPAGEVDLYEGTETLSS